MALPITFATITLDEFSVGTVDPVYTFNSVLGGGGDFTVTFDGEIVTDGANPTSPAISANASYLGPVSIRFDHPISKIEFDAGVFDAAGSTKVILYGRNGYVVDRILNTATGPPYEHFSFDFGENVIERVRFVPLGDEPHGFAVDNISVSLRPESRPVDLSGNAAVDGLLQGTAWNGRTITYSFLTNTSKLPGYGDNPETFTGSKIRHDTSAPFNIDQRNMALSAINAWDDVSLIRFDRVSDTGAAPGMIRMGVAAIADNADAFFPGEQAEAGDLRIKTGKLLNEQEPGTYAYFVFLHEMGHALGLKHPHEAGNPGNIVPAGQDSVEFSVMSYRTFPGAPVNQPLQNGPGSLPQTLMMNDIAAIQYLYGANFSHHSGNDIYAFDPNKTKIFETIWDGGGTDRYDASAYNVDVTINLLPGKWSVLAPGQLAVLKNDGASSLFARGSVFNALQFEGDVRSLIENATGGGGDDRITGNAAGNFLEGGGGDDLLDGLQGVDRLWGEGGRDSLFGGSGNDQLNSGAGKDEFTGGLGDDRIVFRDISDSGLGASSDLVKGFIQGSDTIVLTAIDAKAASGTDNDFTFIGTADFTAAGQLRFFTNGGQTLLAGNVNGDLAADFQIAFDRNIVFTNTDIAL